MNTSCIFSFHNDLSVALPLSFPEGKWPHLFSRGFRLWLRQLYTAARRNLAYCPDMAKQGPGRSKLSSWPSYTRLTLCCPQLLHPLKNVHPSLYLSIYLALGTWRCQHIPCYHTKHKKILFRGRKPRKVVLSSQQPRFATCFPYVNDAELYLQQYWLNNMVTGEGTWEQKPPENHKLSVLSLKIAAKFT